MSKRYPKYEKYQSDTDKPGYWQRIKNFWRDARRIVKVANKPSTQEYWLVFKICAIGMVVLGVLSYVIQLLFTMLPFGT